MIRSEALILPGIQDIQTNNVRQGVIMLPLLLFLLLLAAITVFPVMIAARIVGAQNRSFGYALFALLLQAALSAALQAFIPSQVLVGIASLLLGPAIYAMVLNTTYLRGLVISILFVVIGVAALFLLAPMMGMHLVNSPMNSITV
jgi:hypothetical protein